MRMRKDVYGCLTNGTQWQFLKLKDKEHYFRKRKHLFLLTEDKAKALNKVAIDVVFFVWGLNFTLC